MESCNSCRTFLCVKKIEKFLRLYKNLESFWVDLVIRRCRNPDQGPAQRHDFSLTKDARSCCKYEFTAEVFFKKIKMLEV